MKCGARWAILTGEVLAAANEIIKLIHRRYFSAVTAVKVSCEYAGVSSFTKKNEGVSQWLERGVDPGFERLSRLGVVVVCAG